jgi:hypothetical protein
MRERDGGDVELICVKREAKYFCKWDWTTQITLICLKKSLSTRSGFCEAGRAIFATTYKFHCLPGDLRMNRLWR